MATTEDLVTFTLVCSSEKSQIFQQHGLATMASESTTDITEKGIEIDWTPVFVTSTSNPNEQYDCTIEASANFAAIKHLALLGTITDQVIPFITSIEGIGNNVVLTSLVFHPPNTTIRHGFQESQWTRLCIKFPYTHIDFYKSIKAMIDMAVDERRISSKPDQTLEVILEKKEEQEEGDNKVLSLSFALKNIHSDLKGEILQKIWDYAQSSKN